MLAGTVAFGIGLVAASASPSLPAFGVLGFVVGMALSSVTISYVTIRAASTPDPLLGRVVSLARTVTIGTQPVGMLAGGLLIDAVGGGLTLGAMGVGTLAAAAIFGTSRALRGVVVEQR